MASSYFFPTTSKGSTNIEDLTTSDNLTEWTKCILSCLQLLKHLIISLLHSSSVKKCFEQFFIAGMFLKRYPSKLDRAKLDYFMDRIINFVPVKKG